MPRALVFAHHDPDGLFDPTVVHALACYRRVADDVTLVSTSAARVPPEIGRSIDRFIARPNVGYDFASWKEGLSALGDVARFDEIVCVNDSVYGPLFDPAPLFESPRVSKAAFWGMCLSGQDPAGRSHAPHLQSWFFAMRRPLLASTAFDGFWRSVGPLPTKADVVERHELGMSRRFTAAGFPPAAIHDATAAWPVPLGAILPHFSPLAPVRGWRLARKALRPWPNPSELGWEGLIDSGVPFVKASIFRVNHYGLDLDRVLARLERLGGFDVGMIREHLRRTDPRKPGS